MECPFRFIFVQSCDCIYRSGSGCYDIESCPGNSDAWCAEQIERYTALSERHQRLVEAAREMLNAVTVLCGDECSCFSTCSLANECDKDSGNECLLVARLKAALGGEE